MKPCLLIAALLFVINSYSQNVGIGNSNPAEKLDVSGNINVTGTIKANGVDGTANQVLIKNNAGILQWGDMTEYKNFLTYFSSSTFTVPAGVTKIMVELWAGGGGGNWYCGGGGGGYVKAVLQVVPGNVCTIQVGNGGTNANAATATNGGDTYVSVGGNQFIATGGKGAVYTAATMYGPGLGGAATSSATPRSYIFVAGGRGGMQTKRYDQYSATIFYEITTGGKGGGTYQYPDAGGDVSHNISELTEPTTKMTNAAGADGKVPGGGGASGLTSAGASVLAGSGAKGMAIVYY